MVFLVWTVFVSIIDNVLKPLLLGRGVQVPMLVIFAGSIGGFITSGIIGLFTGAVVLTLGYMLFVAWLHGDGGKTEQGEEADDSDESFIENFNSVRLHGHEGSHKRLGALNRSNTPYRDPLIHKSAKMI